MSNMDIPVMVISWDEIKTSVSSRAREILGREPTDKELGAIHALISSEAESYLYARGFENEGPADNVWGEVNHSIRTFFEKVRASNSA